MLPFQFLQLYSQQHLLTARTYSKILSSEVVDERNEQLEFEEIYHNTMPY